MIQSDNAHERLAAENRELHRRLQEFESREAERKRAAEASRLLAEISQIFMTGGLDDALMAALGHCGRFVRGDRIRVYQFTHGGERLRVTHEWRSEALAGAPAAKTENSDFDPRKISWAIEQYRQGKAVAVDDVQTIPAHIREQLERQGVKSSMSFPIFVNGQFQGFAAAHAMLERRPWSTADQSILRQVCEMIGRGFERMRAEERIRESIKQLERVKLEQEAILRSTPHGMCLLTANWRIVWCNRSLQFLFSAQRGSGVDLTGSPFHLLFKSKEEFDGYTREAVNELRRTGQHQRRCELVRLDGSPFWCEISIVRHDPSATQSGVVATITDVTERLNAERALRDSERRFRSLAQHAADMVIVCGEDARITYANPSVERAVGRPADQLAGAPIFEFVEEDDVDLAQEALGRGLPPPGESRRLELRFRRADGGGSRLLEVIVTNLTRDASVNGIIINARDVTDSRRAAKALRDSEALYESLVGSLTQNIFRKDLDGRFTYANPRFCATVGLTREQILGKTDFDFFPEELAAKYSRDDETVTHTRKPMELIEDNTDAEGRRRVVQVVKTPIFDADGDVTGLQGIFWDITERELAAEALRQSEERYRTFVDNLPMGVFRIEAGSEGRVLAANPAMAQMFAYPEVESFIGARTADLFVSQRERTELSAKLAEFGEVTDTEIRLRRKDGAQFWARCSMRAHRGDDARVDYYDGVMRDISRLKESEEALRQSEERFKAVVENITDGIYEVDLAGNLRYANPGLYEMLGYTREEMIGVNNREYMDPDDARMVFEAFNEVFLTGQNHRGLVYRLRAKDDSSKVVEGSISLVQDGRGLASGFRGVVRDITERKRAEEALHEKTQQLERLNQDLLRKNAELDEFTYIASHDLQEPLRKLVAFSEFLKKDLGSDLPERAAKDIKFIMDASQRMQNLVQDLLQLSRAGKSAMKRERISMEDCANRALDALSVRIESTSAVIHRKALPEVWGDRTVLTQLYQNLIGNALKFISDKRPEITLTAEPEGDYWILGVKDNGIGLKPEYAEQIFAPFKRLHSRDKYEGSGIGLSICRKSVERHGGKIWVESQPGEGAHFKFTIGERLAERGDGGASQP